MHFHIANNVTALPLVIRLHSSGTLHPLVVQVFQILFNSRLNRKLHPPMLIGDGNDIIKNAHMQYVKKITIGHCKPTCTIIRIILIVEMIFSVYAVFYSQLYIIGASVNYNCTWAICRNRSIVPRGVPEAQGEVKSAVDIESSTITYILNGYLLCRLNFIWRC